MKVFILTFSSGKTYIMAGNSIEDVVQEIRGTTGYIYGISAEELDRTDNGFDIKCNVVVN